LLLYLALRPLHINKANETFIEASHLFPFQVGSRIAFLQFTISRPSYIAQTLHQGQPFFQAIKLEMPTTLTGLSASTNGNLSHLMAFQSTPTQTLVAQLRKHQLRQYSSVLQAMAQAGCGKLTTAFHYLDPMKVCLYPHV